jgi:probable F420-dependent oxidoreductase
VILPQRQTVLLAKQAASVDMLSNGRLRLGVGTGWNKVEYEALGVKFEDRGALFDDQIEVLRALWSKPAVTHKTRFHSLNDIGLDIMPVQRPIPLWFGGGNAGTPTLDKVLRRIARVGDGWTANLNHEEEGRARIAKLRGYCKEYGRDPATLGIEGFIVADPKNRDAWADGVKAWHAAGVSHLGVSTTFGMVQGVDAHLRLLEDFRKAIPKDLLRA